MASLKSAPTPKALGFHMPAEWEPHEATWLAWPHEPADWPGKLAPIPWVYGEVVRYLSRGEQVRILVPDASTEKKADALLKRVGVDAKRVEFWRVPTDRSWTRDTCPLFVTDRVNTVAMTNWRFNGWAKYPNHKKDDAINDRIVKRLKMRQWKPTATVAGKPWRVVMEGGSLDVNGRGTILTTEECLLSPVQARNPGMSRQEIEEVLCQHLGARKVLWLGNGIAGDDTHGHVDDLARFVDARTVVIASEDDPRDPNHAPLRENRARLQKMSTADGEKLRVETLPMPDPVVLDGVRLPASYANFYIANAVVLVPTFNDPKDAEALTTLSRLFPTREVVGIHAVDLVWGLGTLHCMTQQQPAGARTPGAR
jgi:agmatine deiminase